MGVLSRAAGYSGAPAATGSTQIPDWVNLAAQNNAQGDSPYEERDEGGLSLNPLRFAGNVVGDLTEIAKGIGAFVGLGLTDVYHGIGDVVEEITPLEDSDNDYYSDDVLKSLVFDPERSNKTGAAGVWEDMFGGIKDDLVKRYVEPFKEGGLAGVAESIYEDPVFAAGDIAALGTIGGAGLASQAKSLMAKPGVMDELAKVGELEKKIFVARKMDEPMYDVKTGKQIEVNTDEINALVREHGRALEALSPDAKYVKRILPGAGLPELATLPGKKPQALGLGGVDAKLSAPSGGIHAVITERSPNPFVRWEKDVIDRMLSRPRDKFVSGIGEDMATLLGEATGRGRGRARVGLEEMPAGHKLTNVAERFGSEVAEDLRILDATDRYGLSRIEYRPVTKLRAQQAFDKMAGFYTTRFYGTRDEYIQDLTDLFDEAAKEGVDPLKFSDVATLESIDIGNIGLFNRDEVRQFFTRQPDEAGNLPSPELVDDEAVRLGEVFSNGEFHRDSGIVEVGSWAQSEVEIQKAAQVLGSPLNIERVGTKAVAATFSPDGQRQVRLRFQTTPVRRMTEAMEDWLKDIPQHNQRITALTNEMNTKIDLISGTDGEARVRLEAEIQGLQRRIEDTYDEIEAIERMVEDYSLLGKVDMADGPVDPYTRLWGKLQILRHAQTLQDARGAGYLKSARGMYQRAFLPMRLELHGHREGKLLPLYDEFRAAINDGNAEGAGKAIEKLKKAGFAEDGDTPEDVLARILRDVYNDPVTRRDEPDFVFDRVSTVNAVNRKVSWKQMHDFYRNEARRATPIYYPFIDPRLTRPGDWLMQKFNIGFLQQKGKPWNKRAMGHLYVNKHYIRDPVDAYSRRAAQVRKSLDMEAFHWDLVTQTGRPLSRIDDIGPHEAIMVPAILKRYLRTKTESEEEIFRQLMQGVSEPEAFAEGFRKAFVKLDDDPDITLEYIAKELFGDDKAKMMVDVLAGRAKNQVGATAKIPTAPDGTPLLYAVPKTVAQRMDAMAKFHLGWKARIFWDAPLNVWRTLILAFSPRWIFNNLLGNVTFLKMQGGNFNDALRLMGGKGARKFARMMGNEDWTPKFLARVEEIMNDPNMPPEIRVGIHGGFFSSTEQQIRHLGAAEGTPYGMLIKGVQSEKWARPVANLSAKMRKFNESIEESFRQASWLNAYDKQIVNRNLKEAGRAYFTSESTLEHLAAKGIDEGSAVRALEEVNKFFNDYMKLGPYERNVIRRYIMPFYSFYKHMVKLLSQYPFTDPVRYQVLEAMSGVSKEMAAEFGALPDWLTGSVPIGQSGEDTVFLNSRGANPFSGLIEGPRGLLSGLSPQFRTFAEFATGTDIVTGKNFSSPDTFTPYGSDQAYRINPETMDVDPTTVRPGLGEILLGQVPQYDLLRDVVDTVMGRPVGARYSTGETMIDPATGEAQFPEDMAVSVGSWAGLSRTPFNQASFIERMTQEERAALIGWLRRNGLLPMPPEEAA